MFLLSGAQISKLKRSSDLHEFVRAICLDYRERFPTPGEGGHNSTALRKTDNLLRGKTRLDPDKIAWIWMFHLRDTTTEQSQFEEYLKRFNVHIVDYRVDESGLKFHMKTVRCCAFLEDFPLMAAWRRLHGLDTDREALWLKRDTTGVG